MYLGFAENDRISACTDDSFTVREISEKKQFNSHITDDYVVTAVYDASVKYSLMEEYGPNSFAIQEDRSLYTEWGFKKPSVAVERFLGFGNKVKMLAPPEMVERMKTALDSIKD